MMMKTILALMFQNAFPMFLGFGANPALNQFKAEQATADTAEGQYGSSAAGEGAQLNPFFSQEMRAEHAFTPGQSNEMLTAAEGGAGGAFGGAEGEINRNAARTNNATGVTKSLDEMARDKSKAAAGASEGIAAADVTGAKQLNQEGAAGLEGLYGKNVSGQLDAMKDATQDISGEMAANPGFMNTAFGSTLGKDFLNGVFNKYLPSGKGNNGQDNSNG